MFTVLFFIVVLAIVGRLVHGWSSAGPALAPHYEAEIARLRGEVDELSAQVVRLTDEQQFMMRLLTSGENRAAQELPPANEETA